MVVVDKTTDDQMRRHELWKLETWETWFGKAALSETLRRSGGLDEVRWDGLEGFGPHKDLFVAWSGRKAVAGGRDEL